jgi:predicted nucleic acid-binding protein
VSHVFSKLFRRKAVEAGDARTRFVDLLDERPALKNSMRLLPRAFEISSETSCALWDALYSSLSEAERSPLLTADEKLYHNLKDRYNVVTLASL